MTRRFSFLKQILSEDVSCQQILFLSADFVSRFLLSADFVFVSRFRQKIFFVSRFVFRQQMSLHLSTKRRSRRHIHFHASLFREGNIFSSGGRAFSLQSRLHSFCRTFQKEDQQQQRLRILFDIGMCRDIWNVDTINRLEIPIIREFLAKRNPLTYPLFQK